MSFENIQLPSSVLSGLYKQVVVTDDYDQVPGGREKRTEEISPAVKTAQAMDTSQAASQGLDRGSGSASSTATGASHQGAAGSNPVFPAAASQPSPVQENSDAASISGWSASPSLPTTPPGDATVYRFLGKNAKHVAIIVYSPNDAYLPDDQLQLLTKMLDACKLNLGDVAIINQASQTVHFTQLAEQLKAQKTLLFGIQPEQIGLPLSFPAYKEQEYAGCTYLLANPLGDMNQPNEEGRSLKGKLWGCLKKMFNI
ncbi:hypothetical protein [Pseudoflavitalea rhizosphaerae]|uniref:hypothetical protein n=1 Tax=Pseudoflavitalea rhizosphaerae TaxID=1884793 RepID=UPI000F8F33F6|nr:hypothetical protein [Pseudoflavitalea rhizosphaerae]